MLRILSGYFQVIEEMMQNGDRKNGVVRSREEAFQAWVRKVYLRKEGYSLRDQEGLNRHVRSQFRSCGFRYKGMYEKWKIFKFEEPASYVDYIYRYVDRQYLDDGWGDDSNLSYRDFVLGPRTRTWNTSELFGKFIGSVELFDDFAGVMREETEYFGYQKEVAELRATVVAQYSKR